MHPPQQPGPHARLWRGRPEPRPTAAVSPRRRRRRPGDVVPQGPAARQHRSRGPPGRRRRRANPHPGRRPPQPNPHNIHDETRQTPDREPPTQPPREAQPGHVTHGHRPDNEHHPFSRRTSTVLTSNKYRSHGRTAAAPTSPRPAPTGRGRGRSGCPYRERPDSQASPRPASPGPSAARRRSGATARPPRTAPPPPPAAAGGRRPARRSRPSTRAPRGG